jgi:serine O-acetyltransferase
MWSRGLTGSALSGLRRDIDAVHARDPASADVGMIEILLNWPGVQAILVHRVAHALVAARVPFLPRLLSTVARAVTGIEIHPAADLGPGLFIDHGMGVVIGETAQIGSDVTIYQGVTLGGLGFAAGKRHPTVGDNVTIGSGAKLLGPITIGDFAKIGANTVVIHDVETNATVVGIPGRAVRIEGRRPEGPDVDWAHLPDPIAEAIKGLARRIGVLERQLAAHGIVVDDQSEANPPLVDADDIDRASGTTSTTAGPSPAGG